MNNKNTFIAVKDDGEEIECDILFTYQDENTGKYYIAYTDGAVDSDGFTKVYASIVSDPEQDSPELEPITTEEEWELIESILETLSSDE